MQCTRKRIVSKGEKRVWIREVGCGLRQWGANRLEVEGVDFGAMVEQCPCRVILWSLERDLPV